VYRTHPSEIKFHLTRASFDGWLLRGACTQLDCCKHLGLTLSTMIPLMRKSDSVDFRSMVAAQLFRCGADTQGRLSSERCGAVTAESLVEISIDTQSLSPGSRPSVDLPLWRVEDFRTASASISRQSLSSSASCHILSRPTLFV
jgi:hypothetical protein